jgi:checkpoint serine/threonine-protein kinase
LRVVVTSKCVLAPCRLIKWTQDTFTAGGHKAELLPLLERCTRELQGAERYRTDVRYLRVWIQYVGAAAPA